MHNDKISGVFAAVAMAAFAVGWWAWGIYIATAILMGVFTAQVAALKLIRGTVPPSTIAAWLLVLVLGALTLLLRDKTYIQLKTTVVYGVFAAALLLADFAFGKNLPKMAFETFFNAPAKIWRRVSSALAAYFFALAICNLLVAKYMSEGAWVGIKTFGFPAATFIFMIVVLVLMSRYMRENLQ